MAAGVSHRVLRAPGRLVVTPTTAFNSGTYPYGGTEIGIVKEVSLVMVGNPAYPVIYESLGEVGELLEPDNRWIFACFVRAWDADAVEQFLSAGYSAGVYSQHGIMSIPGTRVPGAASIGTALKIAYIPDDETHVPGALIYQAIPMWSEDAELAFRRGDELGIPLTFTCLRDGSDRILKVGIMADLAL